MTKNEQIGGSHSSQKAILKFYDFQMQMFQLLENCGKSEYHSRGERVNSL